MMTRHLPVLVAVLATFCAVPAQADEALPLVVRAQHDFSRTEARVRVQQLLDYWSNRYGVRPNWEGNVAVVHGRVMGIAFDARLVVGEDSVEGRTSDPGFLFRKSALDYVNRKLRKYLNRTYAEL